MEQYQRICRHLYEATQIPALLVAQDGHVVAEWSRLSKNTVPEYGFKMAVQDFELQKRDALHPVIFHIKPGYPFAVAKLDAQLYWVTGLVSPVHRSYEEICRLRAGNAVHPGGTAHTGYRAAELPAGHPFAAEKCRLPFAVPCSRHHDPGGGHSAVQR